MVFSGFTFLFLFLPLAVLCSLPFRNITYRNAVLCLFSLVFSAWGEPVYILIMLLSILLNYAAGLLMERLPRQKKPGSSTPRSSPGLPAVRSYACCAAP